jgi:hypothetical protein
MYGKSVFKKLLKVEQMRLPLEGEPEQEVTAAKPKKEKPIPLADPGIFRNIGSWDGLQEYLERRGKPLNSEELFHIATNRENTRLSSYRNLRNILKNTPADVTKEALDKLTNHRDKKEKDSSERSTLDDKVGEIIQYGKLPSDVLMHVLDGDSNRYSETQDGTTYNKVLSAIRNPNIEEPHLLKAIDRHPHLASEIMDNPKSRTKNIIDRVLSEESLKNLSSYQVRNIVQNSMADENMLSPNSAKNILNNKEHLKSFTTTHDLDHVLGRISPEDRKSFIDKKLGITGGGHDITPEEFSANDENFQEHNWNNWTKGDDYDKSISKLLARSKHLDDSHAEHIKRHGDFDHKYDMYHHNPHVDSKHGIEMFSKWRDDNSDHGYDKDELNEANAEHKDDVYTHEHLSDDVREEIRQRGYDSGVIDEGAYYGYSYDTFLSDIPDGDILDKMGTQFDDTDEIYEKLNENYDWTVDNPNSKQNVGRQDFDALEKLAQSYDRNNLLNLDEFKDETGLEHPSEIGIPYNEKADTIDMDHVHDKLEEFGGASTIDYANHDKYTINEHPEFDERYESAAQEWRLNHWNENTNDVADSLFLYEDHRESDQYQEAFREAEREYVENTSKGHVKELYSQSHQEPEFVPEHLHQHMPAMGIDFEKIKRDKQRKAADGGHTDFLNNQIPEREYEHEYGDNLHHYQMARDYADARGGNIDIGTLHKLFPAQKDTWKAMFGDRGKLSSQDISEKIEQIPKNKYNISYGKWDRSKMQNSNRQDQIVFRLDHSPESIKDIEKDPELYSTFKRVQDVSHRSGHPTNKNTIAWARVDMTDPKKPVIDELQSDFGKTVREYLENEGHGHKADHIKQIEAHHKNWRENLINFVIGTAKKHGAEKVFTHSPESKAKHTGADKVHSVYRDSYGKVPKSMGFRPIHPNEMPLTEQGMQNFKTREDETPIERASKHIEAADFHYNLHSLLGDNPELRKYHKQKSSEHHKEAIKLAPGDTNWRSSGNLVANKEKIMVNPGNKHIEAATKTLSENKPFSHEHDSLMGKPLEQGEAIQGHAFDIKPAGLKKHLDLVDTLIKCEILLVKKHMQKQDVTESIANIEYIKELLGYEL